MVLRFLQKIFNRLGIPVTYLRYPTTLYFYQRSAQHLLLETSGKRCPICEQIFLNELIGKILEKTYHLSLSISFHSTNQYFMWVQTGIIIYEEEKHLYLHYLTFSFSQKFFTLRKGKLWTLGNKITRN